MAAEGVEHAPILTEGVDSRNWPHPLQPRRRRPVSKLCASRRREKPEGAHHAAEGAAAPVGGGEVEDGGEGGVVFGLQIGAVAFLRRRQSGLGGDNLSPHRRSARFQNILRPVAGQLESLVARVLRGQTPSGGVELGDRSSSQTLGIRSAVDEATREQQLHRPVLQRGSESSSERLEEVELRSFAL